MGIKHPKQCINESAKMIFGYRRVISIKLLGWWISNTPQRFGEIACYLKLHVFYVKSLPQRDALSFHKLLYFLFLVKHLSSNLLCLRDAVNCWIHKHRIRNEWVSLLWYSRVGHASVKMTGGLRTFQNPLEETFTYFPPPLLDSQGFKMSSNYLSLSRWFVEH